MVNKIQITKFKTFVQSAYQDHYITRKTKSITHGIVSNKHL